MSQRQLHESPNKAFNCSIFFVGHKTLTQTNYGRQLHAHHNHAFSLSQMYPRVRFFKRFNTISLRVYGHIGPTLGSEPLAQVPYVVIGLHRQITMQLFFSQHVEIEKNLKTFPFFASLVPSMISWRWYCHKFYNIYTSYPRDITNQKLAIVTISDLRYP